MTNILPVLDRASAGIPASLERLFELVRIKSISTDPAFKADCRKAAEWLVTELRSLGFDATVRDTPGHPMVVAHHDGARADVPPPFELWRPDEVVEREIEQLERPEPGDQHDRDPLRARIAASERLGRAALDRRFSRLFRRFVGAFAAQPRAAFAHDTIL